MENSLEFLLEHFVTLKELILEREALSFVFPFGKYKGKTIEDVAEVNPGYVLWAAKLDPSPIPSIPQTLLAQWQKNYNAERAQELLERSLADIAGETATDW